MRKILHRSIQTIELIDSNNYIILFKQLNFLTLIIEFFEPFVYVTWNVSHGAQHLRIRIAHCSSYCIRIRCSIVSSVDQGHVHNPLQLHVLFYVYASR